MDKACELVIDLTEEDVDESATQAKRKPLKGTEALLLGHSRTHSMVKYQKVASPMTSGSERTTPMERCVTHINAMPLLEKDLAPCASYCFDWLVSGNCRHPSCGYRHSKLGRGTIALSQAHLGSDFKKNDAFKRSANSVLAELSSSLEKQRCFVLDGQIGATVTALNRARVQVLAPNVDQTVVSALQGKCLATHCTASTALSCAAQYGLHFGCIYLDYMWPLDYFNTCARSLSRSLERLGVQMRAEEQETGGVSKPQNGDARKEAIEEVLDAALDQHDGSRDIERLFSAGPAGAGQSVLSSTGSVLAVTLVHHRQSPMRVQKESLEVKLREGGECLGYCVERLGQCAAKGRGVATVFYGINLPRSQPHEGPQRGENELWDPCIKRLLNGFAWDRCILAGSRRAG